MLIISAPHHGNKWSEGDSDSCGHPVTFLAAAGQMDKLLAKTGLGDHHPQCPPPLKYPLPVLPTDFRTTTGPILANRNLSH